MNYNLNLCTSILSQFTFADVVDIALESGYKGIELRVSDDYHKSLKQLAARGNVSKRQLEQRGLQIPVLNSYLPINDEESVDFLLSVCQKLQIPKARLVLPRSCHGAVSRLAKGQEIIPSYETTQSPAAVIKTVQKTLRQLELKAYRAGVKVLLELHWGTVMSSFSSAFFLTQDLDPSCIGITFDPANMIVEGKEDWEFGLKLIRSHLDNVHVKNVRWDFTYKGWSWDWSPTIKGMVNWGELVWLLTRNKYQGDYAVEDFLVPNNSKEAAINYLSWIESEFSEIYEHYSTLAIPKLQVVAS